MNTVSKVFGMSYGVPSECSGEHTYWVPSSAYRVIELSCIITSNATPLTFFARGFSSVT